MSVNDGRVEASFAHARRKTVARCSGIAGGTGGRACANTTLKLIWSGLCPAQGTPPAKGSQSTMA